VKTATDLRLAAIGLLVASPWLNPFAGGPSSWVGPWLFSAMCACLAFASVRPVAPHPGVPAALAALAAWVLLRSGWAPETLAVAAACLLVWMMASLAATGARRPLIVDTLARAWLVAASVSTAAALLQYFGLADRLAPWINPSGGEAFANLRQRNQFASLTAIGMASLVWLVPVKLGRWWGPAAMMWLAVGSAATMSRTGLLQLLLLGAAACLWPGPRQARARLWALAVATYGIAALGLPWLHEIGGGGGASHLWGRVSGIESCSSRTVLWSNVLYLVAARPWLGWGWGELDFAHYTTLYPGARFCDILDNAHNLPLHLAVELGLPAALLACTGLGWAVWRARPWCERDPARQMAWAVLLVIAVHSLLEYPLWYGPFQMALGLAIGLLWPAQPTARLAPPPGRSRLAISLVALGTLAAAGYAAWDYFRASQIYLPPEQRASGWRHDPLARLDGSWLFRNQVRFAELTLTPVTPENAGRTYEDAAHLLHYSPEPSVIEKLLDSAVALGREDEVLQHLARFRAAFPKAYTAWVDSYRRPPPR